jgi:hypothetical protein
LSPPLRPYKDKNNEKWELMAFLLNYFFQNSRLKYRATGGSIEGFTLIDFSPGAL